MVTCHNLCYLYMPFLEKRQTIEAGAIGNHRAGHTGRACRRRMPMLRCRITLTPLTSALGLMGWMGAERTVLARWIGIFMTQEAD